jgi:hypothetical protein
MGVCGLGKEAKLVTDREQRLHIIVYNINVMI